MLMWVDEIAWVAASLDYPDYNFVTIAMDRIEFNKSVREGSILSFRTEKVRVGRTSVNYLVEVFRARSKSSQADSPHSQSEQGENESIFSTTVTLVRVDEAGQKTEIGK